MENNTENNESKIWEKMILDNNNQSIIIQPNDFYGQAIAGFTSEGRVIYNVAKLVDILMGSENLSFEDAYNRYLLEIRSSFEAMNSDLKPIFLLDSSFYGKIESNYINYAPPIVSDE